MMEEQDGVLTDVSDAFAPQNAPGLSLVALMRIYDVLMNLLGTSNPAAHNQLNKLHAEGRLEYSLPVFDPDSMDLDSE